MSTDESSKKKDQSNKSEQSIKVSFSYEGPGIPESEKLAEAMKEAVKILEAYDNIANHPNNVHKKLRNNFMTASSEESVNKPIKVAIKVN